MKIIVANQKRHKV